MRNDIYQHFHPDERPFVDKVSEWLDKAGFDHQVKLTDFLDPRQAFIVSTLANRTPDASYALYGGYEQAERRRAVLTPDYLQPEDQDFGVRLLVIESDDSRFAELDHGDFLGAILGLGIKREKIGDIHPAADACHCLIAGEIIDYIHLHLQQVHKVHVYTSIEPLEKLRQSAAEFDEIRFSVASMRLDAIVGDVHRLSRAKAVAPIQAGHCKVNWRVAENPSTELREGDVVSLKGFGRFKLLEVEGVNRKGRIRVRAGKYK